MKRFRMLLMGLLSAPLAFAAVAYAAPAGQIEGGDIYRVRNVTKSGAFTDPAHADPCETVQFKVRIHNPGPDPLTNVRVKATLPSGTATSFSSIATVTADNANPASTSDSAGVLVSQAATMSYVTGSTQLLDTNNAVINTLPDGIIGSGVGIGTVGVSIQQIRYVQFQAKLSCPQPTPDFMCVSLDLTKLDDRKVKLTASSTATGGAVFDHYVFSFGDNTTDATTTSSTVEHTYAADGNYTARATVFVKIDGQLQHATSDMCAKPVTFTTTPPPVTPPPTQPPQTPPASTPPQQPAALPNTGSGDVLGMVVSTIAGGSIAYRLVWARYMNRRSLM